MRFDRKNRDNSDLPGDMVDLECEAAPRTDNGGECRVDPYFKEVLMRNSKTRYQKRVRFGVGMCIRIE